MADVLVSTKNWILAEASPHDKVSFFVLFCFVLFCFGKMTKLQNDKHYQIWGIGLPADSPDVQNPNKWKGLNVLGQVLMKVREDLRVSLLYSFFLTHFIV
jgi:predicted NAD-dependent protein-ADP-ribosyltransferase YbiA (DUF1768 family)